MSLPLARRNGSCGLMDNNAELNMALPATGVMTNNQVIQTPDLTLDAARTLFILVTLLSGSVSAKVDEFVPGTSHNFSAPVSVVYISTTTPTYIPVDILDANGLGFGAQLTAGGSGCQFKELLFIDMNELKQGEGWADMTSGQNASAGALIANTLGGTVGGATNTDQDGSGVVARGPYASHTFGG